VRHKVNRVIAVSIMWRSRVRIRSTILLLTLSASICAQVPEFEVASVASVPPPSDGHISTRMSTDNAVVRYSNVTLKDVIAQAYSVAKYQIAGPAWLDDERYVIVAKIPAGATGKQVPAMFQALLRDRFAMKLHRESRNLAVLALVVAKGGPKLKAADSSTGCHGESNKKVNSLDCHTSLAQLAEQLSANADRPVVDKTMLEGPFEISLHWIAEGAASDGGATLLDALPEQLGLRLEAQKAPVETLVVDSANRVPTEN
jgi:uncharacterized protein (TIGR03435 family)